MISGDEVRNWNAFWQQDPQKFDELQFFEQVGKTTKKCAISRDQFEILNASLLANLQLRSTDEVLDVCCGNGIVSCRVAQLCRKVVGIDYSPYLIEIAKKYNKPENVEYFQIDAMSLKTWRILDNFDKIYMYEALQHFHPNQFAALLTDFQKFMKGDYFLFIGSVPDVVKKWSFYNTRLRQIDYYIRKIRGTESIGTWWDKNDIRLVTEKIGLKVNFFDQPISLYTSHYRFDMLIHQ